MVTCLAWWDRLRENLTRPAADAELAGFLTRPMAPFPITLALAGLGLLAAWRHGGAQRTRAVGLALGALISLGLTLEASRGLWGLWPALSFLQFPWRYFGPAAVALGLLLAWLPAYPPSCRGGHAASGSV